MYLQLKKKKSLYLVVKDMVDSRTKYDCSVCSARSGSRALRNINSGISQRSNLVVYLLFSLNSGDRERSLGDGRDGRASNLRDDRRVHNDLCCCYII